MIIDRFRYIRAVAAQNEFLGLAFDRKFGSKSPNYIGHFIAPRSLDIAAAPISKMGFCLGWHNQSVKKRPKSRQRASLRHVKSRSKLSIDYSCHVDACKQPWPVA